MKKKRIHKNKWTRKEPSFLAYQCPQEIKREWAAYYQRLRSKPRDDSKDLLKKVGIFIH